MLFAAVYYLYTARSDDIKNTAQISLKLTRKKTNNKTTPGKNIYEFIVNFYPI